MSQTNDNVTSFPAQAAPVAPPAEGGNGGHGGGTGARLSAVEARLNAVEKSLAVVEAEMKHLATREDIKSMQVSIMVWGSSLIVVVLAAGTFLLNLFDN